MESNRLLKNLTISLIKQVRVSRLGDGFKIALPLLEPNGDQISVYVEESSGKIKVHDGGRINGILFGVGPAGAASEDYNLANEIVESAELRRDSQRGIVFAEAEERDLDYWIMEVGRTIAVIASIIPVKPPPLKQPSKSPQS